MIPQSTRLNFSFRNPQSAFRNRSRLLFLLISFLIAGVLVVRSGGSAPGLVNSAGKALPPDAAPLSQQVLRVMSPEPRTLDATVNLYDTESTILPFETLLRRDENWEPVPAGADRYTASKDGKTWTFFLRRGARWSDGHPVTAHDYVYSFRRRLDPAEANPYAFFYYDIKNAQAINKGQIKDRAQLGVRAVDDLTLIIETEHPCPYLPYIVSFGDVYPVPSWQVEKYGRKWTEPGRCVSNSGFKLAEWAHGDRMVFVLDPNYNGPHKPFLEKVIHPFRYASTATILPYENDEVDIEGVDVTDLERVERDPRLKRELIRTPARSTWYLFFRTKQRPFNDIRVREAFARAIDREVICRVVLRGTAVPAYSMLPPGFKDYAGPSYKPVQGFDPARAKQLLRDAGYPNGRGFPKVEVWLRAPSPSIQLVGASIQGMLKEHLGIETTIRTADRTMYMDNLYNWRMNVGLLVFVADYVDPRNMLDMIWHSQPQGYGRHDWANLEFDRLVEAAASELNPARRSQLYRQAEAILVKDYGGAFVFHPESLELRKSWVKDTKLDRTGKVAVFDFTRVYVARH